MPSITVPGMVRFANSLCMAGERETKRRSCVELMASCIQAMWSCSGTFCVENQVLYFLLDYDFASLESRTGLPVPILGLVGSLHFLHLGDQGASCEAAWK